MKYMNWLIGSLLLLSFVGCLDDKGSYDYTKLNEPVWKLGEGSSAIWVSCRAGEMARFRSTPFFTWLGDSVARAAEVRYEWKVNGVVLSEEADFEIETDKLMNLIKLSEYPKNGVNGTFSIVEKETDIAYMVRVYLEISPTNTHGDWVILSEKGGNSKLSYVRSSRNQETFKMDFVLLDDIYFNTYGSDIPGKPISMGMGNNLTNIGVLGAVSVMTDQVAYEFNCESMMKVGELQEEFSPVPADFKPVSRMDAYATMTTSGVQSFIAMEDGKIYRRMMTMNNLGGNFVSTPLVVDEKGYKVTAFGQPQIGFSCIPCYDEKNNRMLTIIFYQSGEVAESPWGDMPMGDQYQLSKLVPAKVAAGVSTEGMCPAWQFPEGTEFIHASYAGYASAGFFGPYYSLMNVFYNGADGKTRWGIYAVNNKDGLLANVSGVQDVEFPGRHLDENSVILTAGASSNSDYPKENYVVYANGNEIRYVKKNEMSDHPFITLNGADKVTYMNYTVYREYEYLIVGTETGKLLFSDANTVKENPELLKEFDLEGRIASVKEVDSNTSSGDRY